MALSRSTATQGDESNVRDAMAVILASGFKTTIADNVM